MRITLVLFVLAFWSTCSLASNVTEFIYDQPDLVVNSSIALTAFKSTVNDQILAEKNTTRYNQLSWATLGMPSLVQTVADNLNSLLTFHENGFIIRIQTLSESIRDMLLNSIMNKYKIKVDPNQIVSIVPSQLNCQLPIDQPMRTTLLGRGRSYSAYPFEVDFTMPLGTSIRQSLEKRVRSNDNSPVDDLKFNCELVVKSLSKSRSQVDTDSVNKAFSFVLSTKEAFAAAAAAASAAGGERSIKPPPLQLSSHVKPLKLNTTLNESSIDKLQTPLELTTTVASDVLSTTVLTTTTVSSVSVDATLTTTVTAPDSTTTTTTNTVLTTTVSTPVQSVTQSVEKTTVLSTIGSFEFKRSLFRLKFCIIISHTERIRLVKMNFNFNIIIFKFKHNPK
jgi:hypothetical protein